MEAWNPNHIGGDISNGEASLRQMLARPVPRWNTYRTPVPGTYLASAATPPGPAVHGQCGDNAARVALREVFGVRTGPAAAPGDALTGEDAARRNVDSRTVRRSGSPTAGLARGRGSARIWGKDSG